MGRGAWRATVHGVAKSWTRLNDKHFQSRVSLQSVLFTDDGAETAHTLARGRTVPDSRAGILVFTESGVHVLSSRQTATLTGVLGGIFWKFVVRKSGGEL